MRVRALDILLLLSTVIGSYSSGGVAARQENIPLGQRLVLRRWLFADQNGIVRGNPSNESHGILLWIE